MTFTGLLARWFWLAIGLSALVISYNEICNNDNIDLMLEWVAPPYVPLSEEEIFKRSDLPCVRPTGAKVGCTYPKVETEPPTGDAFLDRSNAKLTQLRQFQSNLAIQGPEYLNRKVYVEREISPRRDRLIRWSAVVFSLAAAIAVLYSLASIRTWWRSHSSSKRGKIRPNLVLHNFASRMRRILSSRKLQSVEKDYQTLKSLHENGLISDQIFEQRKSALRASIDDEAGKVH